MPHRRPFSVRNTGIEVDAGNDPTSDHEDSRGKFRRVVIGMIVAEGVFGMPEKIPAIEERNGALGLRFYWHVCPRTTGMLSFTCMVNSRWRLTVGN